MITVFDLAEQDTSLKKASYNEYAGPCPDCGGNDRFRVKSNKETGKWAFMCRGCWDSQEILSEEVAKRIGKKAGEKRGWGDAIDYLRHYRHMNYSQARAFLGEQEETPAPQWRRAAHVGYESADWQTLTTDAMVEYEALLWSAEGEQALEYIRGRGLADETIKKAHIGFSEVGGIPRLLLPVFNDGRYVAIYRRDLRPDCLKGERWKDVPGGTKDELYLADCLRMKRPTILTEAAIDALSVAQECGGMVNVVATGSTDGARSAKVLIKLALMPVVFIAFDADVPGDRAAQWWLDHLPNARRLRPFLHDVNDMLTDGWDIRAWIGQAIQEYQQQMAQTENKYLEKVLELDPTTDRESFLAMPEDQQQAHYEALCDDPDACVICLEPAAYEHEGSCYCETHHPGRAALVQFADLVTQATPSEKKGPLQVKGIHLVRDWPQIKAQLIAEMREEYTRQQHLQQERDRQRLVAAHNKKMKRYAQNSMQQETLIDPVIVASIGAIGGFMVDLHI